MGVVVRVAGAYGLRAYVQKAMGPECLSVGRMSGRVAGRVAPPRGSDRGHGLSGTRGVRGRSCGLVAEGGRGDRIRAGEGSRTHRAACRAAAPAGCSSAETALCNVWCGSPGRGNVLQQQLTDVATVVLGLAMAGVRQPAKRCGEKGSAPVGAPCLIYLPSYSSVAAPATGVRQSAERWSEHPAPYGMHCPGRGKGYVHMWVLGIRLVHMWVLGISLVHMWVLGISLVHMWVLGP